MSGIGPRGPRRRVQAGVREGGQFATEVRSEADVHLISIEAPSDPDGIVCAVLCDEFGQSPDMVRTRIVDEWDGTRVVTISVRAHDTDENVHVALSSGADESVTVTDMWARNLPGAVPLDHFGRVALTLPGSGPLDQEAVAQAVRTVRRARRVQVFFDEVVNRPQLDRAATPSRSWWRRSSTRAPEKVLSVTVHPHPAGTTLTVRGPVAGASQCLELEVRGPAGEIAGARVQTADGMVPVGRDDLAHVLAPLARAIESARSGQTVTDDGALARLRGLLSEAFAA